MGSSKSKRVETGSKPTHSEPANEQQSASLPSNTTRLKSAEPLKMPNLLEFTCERCSMTFPTDEALYKHRTRFCTVGKDADNSTRSFYPTNGVHHSSPSEKKRDEVQEWKNQRTLLQTVQDMEDRILRDSQKTQKLALDLKKRTHNYSEILLEYDRLQAQERDVIREMFNLQSQPMSHKMSSMDLSEYQAKQLEVLQRQITRLERERQAIQAKLENLIVRNEEPTPMGNHEPYRLLREMRDQQEVNERTLGILGERLKYSGSLSSPRSDISSLPYLHTYSGRYRLPIEDNLRYTRSNSYDANRVFRNNSLDRRLRDYEYYPWIRGYPEPLKHYRSVPMPPIETIGTELKLSKVENHRLQTELDAMQYRFQKLDSRTRQLELTVASSAIFDSKSADAMNPSSIGKDRYATLNPSTYTSSRPNQVNLDRNFNDTSRNYPPTSFPALDQRRGGQPMNADRLRDPLGPHPYDPITGFVMFYDFILNLPSVTDQCRLITCLHHPQSGLGAPSQLEATKCDFHIDETSGDRMAVVIIGTRQPVPRCPPHELLAIMIEVQVTSKQAPNAPLRTTSWTKIPLFDHKNRLASGRWKVPLRALPIQQDESFANISTLPTLARAELYYRLVHPQEAQTQSEAMLSPRSRDLYFYPPQD